MNKDADKKGCIISVAAVLVVAVLGSVFTHFGSDWFEALTKPSEWIPSFVIPIIWTVIYVSFAIVLCLWQNKKALTTKTIVLLSVNGVLNVLWCLSFFTLKSLFWGDIIIVINTVFAFLLVTEIYKANVAYGIWLSIYPIWLSIAATLNIAVWILN